MKVRELIEALQEFDGELEIIAGTDEEGNDYQNLYFPQETWAAEDDSYRCGLYPVHPDDMSEYDEDELVKVVVF